jgi:uncharacterized integral membrane protein
MSVLHRTRTAPAEPAAPSPQSPVEGLSSPLTGRVPRTRTGAAWIGICAAALSFVVLIVFMLQNTGSVGINFLWMSGSLPLALALLVAGVAMAILAMTVGVARMTQLRRLLRQRRS